MATSKNPENKDMEDMEKLELLCNAGTAAMENSMTILPKN